MHLHDRAGTLANTLIKQSNILTTEGTPYCMYTLTLYELLHFSPVHIDILFSLGLILTTAPHTSSLLLKCFSY